MKNVSTILVVTPEKKVKQDQKTISVFSSLEYNFFGHEKIRVWSVLGFKTSIHTVS